MFRPKPRKESPLVTAVMDPTVSAYNAYADVEFANTYIQILGATNQIIWISQSVSAQNAALVLATQQIDVLFTFPESYERVDPTQELEFPKKYVPVGGIRELRKAQKYLPRKTDCGYVSNKFDYPYLEYGSTDYSLLFLINSRPEIAYYPVEFIPAFLSQATVDFAILLLDNADLSTLSSEEIRRVKLDVIELEYFRNIAKTRGAPTISKLAKWGIQYNASLLDTETGTASSGRIGF